MDMIYKTYRAEVKGVNADEGTVDMLIPVSTASVDRDGEIVEPSAFKKTLPKFMKRPVLVSSHDYRDLTSQIGEWTRLKITDMGVEGKPKYYINEGNEQADWGFKLASKGMAAFSIGFIPKEWVDGDGVKEPRRTYKEVELLEISQVIIPSNREAIQSIRSKSVDPITNKLMDDILEDKELVTKPEETERYIRIPIRECKITATIDISPKEGIKALYCGKEKEIATYLFAKDKGWTMEKAKKWVKDHGKEYIIGETTTTENGEIIIMAVKIPDMPQIYREHKEGQESIIDEIDYLKTLIDKEGLSLNALEKAIELSFKVLDIFKRTDLGYSLSDEQKELIKRISGSDIPVKDIKEPVLPVVETLTNQDILEAIKRVAKI